MRCAENVKRLALFLLITSGLQWAVAGEIADKKTKLRDGVENILEKAKIDEGYPGISAAIYLRGQPYHVAASGFSDVSRNIPPDQDTIFRAYSLTKGITQILAAMLAETGELDLDMPISKYIPDLPETIQAVTVQQLLLHQAGIRHYENSQEWLRLSAEHCEDPEDAFKQFLNDPLVSMPGSGTNYSSFGYVLLSEILERAGKKSFRELLEQRILSKTQSHRVGLESQTALGKFTTFYEPTRDGYKPAPSVDNSCKFGGGALVATPWDMAKIFSDFYGGKLTSKATLEHFVPAISRPCEAVSMGGEGMGGRAALVAYPSENLVVILMANARGGDLTSYGRQIADLVFREEKITAACEKK